MDFKLNTQNDKINTAELSISASRYINTYEKGQNAYLSLAVKMIITLFQLALLFEQYNV